MKTISILKALAAGMTSTPFISTLLAAVFAVTLPMLAIAEDDHEQARRLVESGDILPLETILEWHQSTAPGEILEIEFETEHGQPVYEIEWLNKDGQVIEWLIDARSGKRIGQERH